MDWGQEGTEKVLISAPRRKYPCNHWSTVCVLTSANICVPRYQGMPRVDTLNLQVINPCHWFHISRKMKTRFHHKLVRSDRPNQALRVRHPINHFYALNDAVYKLCNFYQVSCLSQMLAIMALQTRSFVVCSGSFALRPQCHDQLSILTPWPYAVTLMASCLSCKPE